jgi:hypothetical protein
MSTIESVNQYIGIIIVVSIAISLIIVNYYAEPGLPYHTLTAVLFCYFCSFGILLIIPADIASTEIERLARGTGYDAYYYNVHLLSVLYNFFFISLLVMGSIILVFQEYYNTDGKSNIKNYFFYAYFFSYTFPA